MAPFRRRTSARCVTASTVGVRGAITTVLAAGVTAGLMIAAAAPARAEAGTDGGSRSTIAAAGAPTPAGAKGLPTGIEDLAPYVKQTSCDPGAKPGSLSLARLLTRTYPGTSTGVSRACAADGMASEHYEGRAVDWMVSIRNPGQASQATALIEWLLAADGQGRPYANARRLGVMYIIWNNRIWGSYSASSGWRAYSTCAAHPDSRYDTTCHRDHVHLSLSWAGAQGRTSFWSGDVAATDYGPCRAADLNWAPTASGPNRSACRSYPVVSVPSGASSTLSALIRYSGIPLVSGASGAAVRAVQTGLGIESDGSYGAVTAAAVSAFRSAHGLTAGPTVDAATWRALIAAARTAVPAASSGNTAPRTTTPSGAGALTPYAGTVLRYDSRGPAVLALQRALNVTPVSGWFGPVTRAAVVRLQQTTRLPATGVVDAATWKALGA